MENKDQDPLQAIRFAQKSIVDAVEVAKKVIEHIHGRYPNGVSLYNPASQTPSEYIRTSAIVPFYSKDGEELYVTGICGISKITFIQELDNREAIGIREVDDIYPPDIVIVASQLAEALLK